MATSPTLTRRLLRTKQAAAYLSMSEWKLRRLIQSAIFPIVQDHEGGPFLLCAGSGCVHRGQQTSCRQCDGLAPDSNRGLFRPFARPCPKEDQMRVSAVTSDLLDRYVDRRQQQGAKNATINRELAALKRMFHLGHLWCKDPLSPARSQGRTN
jgi:hypothetical protein